MSAKQKSNSEPLFHIVKRDSLFWWESWTVRAIAIVAALIISGIVTYAFTGLNPFGVYAEMFKGNFGTSRRIWTLLQGVAMLLCVSLAVTPAFKMKFWNIGAEGQVLVGALATAACMLLLGDKLPPVVLFIVMIAASIAAGGVWALFPALFKAKWGTNETLFTLMMNYIAIQILNYFSMIWSVPKGSGKIGVINAATKAGWIPEVNGNKYLINILVVAVITVLMYIYLKYSKQGYEISVVGESENTAKYIGINVKKVIIRTMIISGALCGIAGFLLVSGTNHTVDSDTAGGRGFTAIMVSWLAKFNPLYMVLTSFLLIFMQKGATQISTTYNLNHAFSDIVTGIIIFFIIGSEFLINYQIKFRKKEEVK